MPTKAQEPDSSYHLPRLAEASVDLLSSGTVTTAVRAMHILQQQFVCKFVLALVSVQQTPVWDKEASHCFNFTLRRELTYNPKVIFNLHISDLLQFSFTSY